MSWEPLKFQLTMQTDWHTAEWPFLFYVAAQFILENKLLIACWKIIKDLHSLHFSFKMHEFDLEPSQKLYGLQCVCR